MTTRRRILSGGALLASASAMFDRFGLVSASGQHKHRTPQPAPSVAPTAVPSAAPSSAPIGYTPVETPNGATLPFTMDKGVKQFRLVAQPVKREFAPGMTVNCWGYNGLTPGPTIEAIEGDRVRIFVTNRLPEHTSVHWHGLFLPNGMDGVSGLTQPSIKPGETYVYEFPLRQHGTYMYHPHADETTQMAMGMMGFFVIHPRRPTGPRIDRDFCLFPHEWFIEPTTFTPNPNVMVDFNIFTFNGRAFPGTAPLVVRLGQRVRIRAANVSMDSHPLHIHGHRMWLTQTDGGPMPPSAWWPESTINVPPGTTRTVEFEADLPGDWPFHCHKAHHAMNAMNHDIPNVLGVDQNDLQKKLDALLPGSMAMGTTGMSEHAAHAEHLGTLPNTLPMMTGAGPYGNIEMGGMFTVIKIREGLTSYEDPGWYKAPAGTVAWKVDE